MAFFTLSYHEPACLISYLKYSLQKGIKTKTVIKKIQLNT